MKYIWGRRKKEEEFTSGPPPDILLTELRALLNAYKRDHIISRVIVPVRALGSGDNAVAEAQQERLFKCLQSLLLSLNPDPGTFIGRRFPDGSELTLSNPTTSYVMGRAADGRLLVETARIPISDIAMVESKLRGDFPVIPHIEISRVSSVIRSTAITPSHDNPSRMYGYGLGVRFLIDEQPFTPSNRSVSLNYPYAAIFHDYSMTGVDNYASNLHITLMEFNRSLGMNQRRPTDLTSR